jgi:uncharacterized protein YceK
MKILLLVFLTVLTNCTTEQKKEIPQDNYSGVYVSEMVFDSGKQWDTLDVRKVDSDSFLIFYTDRYIKKMPGGQWTGPKFIHDTFPAVFRADLNTLMVGDPLSMPVDTVDGKPVHVAPYRPMHIDTVRKSAVFGGFHYKKIR